MQDMLRQRECPDNEKKGACTHNYYNCNLQVGEYPILPATDIAALQWNKCSEGKLRGSLLKGDLCHRCQSFAV
jgi:hypothetical protein